MKKSIFNKKIFLSWLWVALCSIGIFLTVPIARRIQKFVYENWGRNVFIYFVLAVLTIGLIILLYFLIFKLKIKSKPRYIWLIIIMALYGYFSWKIRDNPEETIHFLEYGLLGFFLFKALSHSVKDKSIYFTATFFAFLIGIFDEILQWITPERFWGFRDIALNGLSGGLVQLTMWKVIKPKIITKKINMKSFRIFTAVFAASLILLGLSVSNTPHRVVSYTKRIPWLFFLQKEEPMSEFGYKYQDPEIGIFYSRLSQKRLIKTDKIKGAKYAQILNGSVDMNYEQFLKEYNPAIDPFMHELRVHIFRRDTYFQKAISTSNLNRRSEFYFIAYKENLILEKYFKNSIEKSVLQWNENNHQESEILIDKSKSYHSPVSANLFSSFSESTVWFSILALILILVLTNLILSYKKL